MRPACMLVLCLCAPLSRALQADASKSSKAAPYWQGASQHRQQPGRVTLPLLADWHAVHTPRRPALRRLLQDNAALTGGGVTQANASNVLASKCDLCATGPSHALSPTSALPDPVNSTVAGQVRSALGVNTTQNATTMLPAASLSGEGVAYEAELVGSSITAGAPPGFPPPRFPGTGEARTPAPTPKLYDPPNPYANTPAPNMPTYTAAPTPATPAPTTVLPAPFPGAGPPQARPANGGISSGVYTAGPSDTQAAHVAATSVNHGNFGLVDSEGYRNALNTANAANNRSGDVPFIEGSKPNLAPPPAAEVKQMGSGTVPEMKLLKPPDGSTGPGMGLGQGGALPPASPEGAAAVNTAATALAPGAAASIFTFEGAPALPPMGTVPAAVVPGGAWTGPGMTPYPMSTPAMQAGVPAVVSGQPGQASVYVPAQVVPAGASAVGVWQTQPVQNMPAGVVTQALPGAVQGGQAVPVPAGVTDVQAQAVPGAAAGGVAASTVSAQPQQAATAGAVDGMPSTPVPATVNQPGL